MAVVGGGVSGLAAIKCCRDEGLDVVCFERRNDLGGLWNYTETVEPGQSNVTRFVIITKLSEHYEGAFNGCNTVSDFFAVGQTSHKGAYTVYSSKKERRYI